MDTLTILDRTGDTKLTWDPSDPDQCATAREVTGRLNFWEGY